jgi:hypothetical protein
MATASALKADAPIAVRKMASVDNMHSVDPANAGQFHSFEQ